MMTEWDVLKFIRPCMLLNNYMINVNNFAHKSILVTGAAGYIGSALCKELMHLNAGSLIAIDNDEVALKKLCQDVSRVGPTATTIKFKLGATTNYNFIADLIFNSSIDYVFHLAAYKNIPLVECNPIVAIKNNIFGTLSVAQAAIRGGVKNFIFVSSFMPIFPFNVVYTTKRFAEICLYTTFKSLDCKFRALRLHNVILSTGSVVSIFRDQMINNQKITLTSKKMVRYFITTQEAIRLIIYASCAANGDILILNGVTPINMLDMAQHILKINCSEHNTHFNKFIDIIGVRPGEYIDESDGKFDLGHSTHNIEVNKISATINLKYDIYDELIKLDSACNDFNTELAKLILFRSIKKCS